MDGVCVGAPVIRLKSIHSSLDWARANYAKYPSGTVLVVDHIEQARGRAGRRWEVRHGQLLVTIMLRPCVDSAHGDVSQLPMVVALAAIEATAQYGVFLKWPNDLVADGRKLGGMLVETVYVEGRLDAVIVGMGINVNTRFTLEDSLATYATSLALVAQRAIDAETVLHTFLEALRCWYARWCQDERTVIFESWKHRILALNHPYRYRINHQSLVDGIITEVWCNGDATVSTTQGVHLLKSSEAVWTASWGASGRG